MNSALDNVFHLFDVWWLVNRRRELPCMSSLRSAVNSCSVWLAFTVPAFHFVASQANKIIRQYCLSVHVTVQLTQCVFYHSCELSWERSNSLFRGSGFHPPTFLSWLKCNFHFSICNCSFCQNSVTAAFMWSLAFIHHNAIDSKAGSQGGCYYYIRFVRIHLTEH